MGKHPKVFISYSWDSKLRLLISWGFIINKKEIRDPIHGFISLNDWEQAF
ncbi:MAG TPA: hypothetical protein VKY40_05025 [Halanaerobiales bacterium]|nr:hypothetical protein [Halanaerobiales bacterium]